MDSRPTSTHDGSLSGDGRTSFPPASTPSNLLEDLQTDAHQNLENKVVKPVANETTEFVCTDTLIDARTNRFKGKQGRAGKNVAMSGVKANEEDESEKSQSKGMRRRDSKWEVLSNLESGTQYTIRPKKSEGYLAKRRRWPLKGWHKR